MTYLVPCRHLDTMEYKDVIVEAPDLSGAIVEAMLTHDNIALAGKIIPFEWPTEVQ
jgi:hypothetical protein